MPEGDTLWRIASRLSPVLVGRRVTGFRAASAALATAGRRHRLEGSTITAVDARGKHLLVRFSTGVALHTHLGMTGSWHLYRTSSRWRQPAHLARVVIEAGDVLAVCFVPRVLELVPEGEETAHAALSALGPDVVAEGFDPAAAIERLQARGAMEIGAALLDQTALAGVGNIYKSEVLFLCGIDPFTPVARLSTTELERIVKTAHRVLRESVVAPRARTTMEGGRYRVYARRGRPCPRCATRIRRERQGVPARTTYWCPRCQRPRA